MGLTNDLVKLREKVESIGVGYRMGNVLSLKGDMCYYYIPVGFIDDEYRKDITYSGGEVVSMINYVKPATYYTYTNPITLNLMSAKIHLDKSVVEVLKKYNINIYEIDVILGGRLKDMSINGKYHYSWECEKLDRVDQYHVNITIPQSIPIGKENICICSAYQPDKIYYITTEELSDVN